MGTNESSAFAKAALMLLRSRAFEIARLADEAVQCVDKGEINQAVGSLMLLTEGREDLISDAEHIAKAAMIGLREAAHE